MNEVRRVSAGRVATATVAALACAVSLIGVGSVPAGASGPSARSQHPARATNANAPTAGSGGYWVETADGGVFTFGGVPFEGSAGAIRPNPVTVGMSSTPSGHGYWLLSANGGIFAFGDALYSGAVAGLPPAQQPRSPLVAMAPTASGQGYWVVAANGSIYSFGDAAFHGSLGGVRLAAPIVTMAATPTGAGYWLVASDGGVFSFGDAQFFGSTGAIRLARPIVGMAASASGNGYWMVASDGGIFAFGDAGFHGSTGALKLNAPIVSMASTLTGNGYWLVASDGGIFTFGDAPFRGSKGGQSLYRPVVAIAVGASLNPYPAAGTGYDISWPQCGGAYPPAGFAFSVVGVNDGRAFTHNPCLASEMQWASSSLATVYMNINAPPAGDPQSLRGPAGTCLDTNTGCMAYNYGYNAAVDALGYATANGVNSSVWWVDVETANQWDTNQFNNSRTIQGALDALASAGPVAGIYSTYLQFPEIAGSSYRPGGPIWVPDSWPSHYTVDDYCNDTSLGFAGGTPWLIQSLPSDTSYDQDVPCPAT